MDSPRTRTLGGRKTRAGIAVGWRGAGNRGISWFAGARPRAKLEGIRERDGALESAVGEHRLRRPQRQYWRALDGSCADTQELDRAASRAGCRRIRMGRLCAELGPAPFLQPRGWLCGHREPQDDSGWLSVRRGLRMGFARALSANPRFHSAGPEERAQVKRRGHGSLAE